MKVSIVIPAYNQERILAQSIQSALDQDYQDKEIIVIDDNSTDKTFILCESFKNYNNYYCYKNQTNLGLAGNLNELIKKSTGGYIVILCGDDVFTNPKVISDMVNVFESNYRIGVVGRYYYQYLDGYDGAVMTIRGDIFTSSCQPSGIGFRREAIQGEFTSKLFVEIPDMIKKIIKFGWCYKMLQYDTIAARLHPGKKGNAATNPDYYKQGGSPTLNWYEVLGEVLPMYLGFIQFKNRAPWMLIPEIKMTIKLNPKCLLNPKFWFCALTALIVPGWILRPLSNWYRHRITRHFCKIIERS